jgi:biopolymer transport protein TolQ
MEFFAAVPAALGRSLFQILADSGRFGLFILCITFVLSVMTWAVVWDRARFYSRLKSRGEALRKAMSNRGIAPCMADADRYLPAIEASILLEARRFVADRAVDGVATYDDPAQADHDRTRLKAMLEARAQNDIGEMERHLILLSTTASTAPFLGLLGTVWGIMHSFLSMGVEGAASIEVVGPGIAEALITTIAGLATAIPALVAYNAFVRSVQRKEMQLDLFISRTLESVIVVSGAGQRSMNSPRPARTGATI